MQRTILAISICAWSAVLCGCAVIKTTDVTDASFKRHQSVSLLGWPLYTRVTDKEPGITSHVATKIEAVQDPNIRRAEMLSGSMEFDFHGPDEM
jgi:hypothetical protein